MKITSIISESQHKCPHCGGPVVEYSELEEGKKDACYYKVKASAKVWPSAYASGRLVQCRKKGASNYGKGKNESVAEDQLDEKWSQKYKSSINCSNPKGFSQKAHCAGKKKNESVDQGVAEDLSRRGFLKGLGAAVAGAAGLGAAGAAQARATPEWMAKVAQAKELFNKGLSPEQVAKKLGVSGANNNMVGPMGGDWGAINYAYREVQRSRGTDMNEEFNSEYNDEAGMAHGSLLTVKRAVDGLMSTIDRGDDLPEWCQEKISLAEDYLVTVWDYIQSEKEQGVDPEIEEMYEAMDQLALEMAHKKGVSVDLVWETFEALDDNMLYETAAWRRKEGKSKKGGLNAKGVASYRRENPGSKLQMAVTTKPSKLKPGSKAAKRRKSFCARMSGVKGPMKKPNGKPTRKALALRKWNC